MMNKLVVAAGLMLLLLTCSLGCSVDCRYDLSGAPPFSAYVGKNVTLTRPMLLVETRDPGPPESSMVLVDPSLPDYPDYPEVQRQHKESLRSIALPVGTKLRVENTYLWKRGQLGVYFRFLQSKIAISGLQAQGWPSDVQAGFSHASIPGNNWFWLFMCPFQDTIRVAPWEPLDTPVSRRFDMPRGLACVPVR